MTTSALSGVADIIDRLSMWLRREVPGAVSSSAVTTLDSLQAWGPQRISDLATREALTQPGMTLLVNRLEAAGHAERVADPSDKRAALVRITEAGRAVLAERHAARTDRLLAELDRLSAADQALLVAARPAIEQLIRRTREAVDA